MARFRCSDDHDFLDFSHGDEWTWENEAIVVKEIRPNSLGILRWFHMSCRPTWMYIHSDAAAYTSSDDSVRHYSELEIYGVLIRGHKLQKLIRELQPRGLLVNRQGLCLTYTGDLEDTSLAKKSACYYQLYDHFDWSKYGVNVPDPRTEPWSIMNKFPHPDRYKVRCEYNRSNVLVSSEQSQVIRLNGDNLFISCKGGPNLIMLWKVDCHGGEIRNVGLKGMIDHQDDNSMIEVRGFTLRGDKVRTLRDELVGRHVMGNLEGWCLFYTGDPTSVYTRGQGGYYYRLTPRFDWCKYVHLQVLPPGIHHRMRGLCERRRFRS